MTNAKKERIKELEKELAPLFTESLTLEERRKVLDGIISGTFHSYADNKACCALLADKSKFLELRELYIELSYKPEPDEQRLAYLFREDMSVEDKLKALADAWWYATNSGYSDAMANRLMSGREDSQTELWELNCKNKYIISRYYDWLKEESENQ